MGIVIAFRRRRHARASKGSRAASRARSSAVTPFESAVSVESTEDHHSAGILSRCHHLRTAVIGAPTSEASALSDASRVEPGAPHSAMTSRNEEMSDIHVSLGQKVPKRKAIVSHDDGAPYGLSVLMRKRQGSTGFVAEFLQRTRRARETSGYKTKAELAMLLFPELSKEDAEGKYKQYERRSLLPHYLIPTFCQLTSVDVRWFVTGQGNMRPRPTESARALRRA